MILKQKGYPDTTVADYREASTTYERRRDDTGEGASTFDDGRLFLDGAFHARISYNGRVWPGIRHVEGETALYEPERVARTTGPSTFKVIGIVHFDVACRDIETARPKADRALVEEMDDGDLINDGRVVTLIPAGTSHIATATVEFRIMSSKVDPMEEAVARLEKAVEDSGLFTMSGQSSSAGVLAVTRE